MLSPILNYGLCFLTTGNTPFDKPLVGLGSSVVETSTVFLASHEEALPTDGDLVGVTSMVASDEVGPWFLQQVSK